MIQLKKILVPTDFSDFSHCALRYGCELAQRFSAQLHLLNVVEDLYPLIPDPGMTFPPPETYVVEMQTAARKAILGLPPAEMCGELSIIREVVAGVPFLEIVRYAREQSIDMIVIGTHGRSGLAHVLMGSVAEKIVRKSPCPVLTVRPEGHGFVMP
ncbi:universal stress protein [Planctomicrobium sp. SH661]|uniref:universal stress protein n=1 Tax=Planctomicrobium sp. SH661 TaxID=3448124 RepID=UPI003F5B9B86